MSLTLPPLAAPPVPLTPVPPAVPLLAAAEFAARHCGERVELVDGVVTEVPMAHQLHGKICFRVAQAIGNHVDAADCGHVTCNDSYVHTRSDPDRVRGAGVCFFSYERIPKGPFPAGLLAVRPDLVAEVKSPTDRWGRVFAKVGEYLEAGVRAVVVVDIESRSASVYRADAQQQILSAEAELTLPDVLPGFAVAVGKLFA